MGFEGRGTCKTRFYAVLSRFLGDFERIFGHFVREMSRLGKCRSAKRTPLDGNGEGFRGTAQTQGKRLRAKVLGLLRPNKGSSCVFSASCFLI